MLALLALKVTFGLPLTTPLAVVVDDVCDRLTDVLAFVVFPVALALVKSTAVPLTLGAVADD